LRAEGDVSPVSHQLQQLQSLYASPRLLDLVSWYRLPLKTEWLIVGLLAIQAVVVTGFHRPARWYAMIILLLFWFLALRWGDTWVPLSPGILAFVMAHRMRRPQATSSEPPADPVVAVEAEPETVTSEKTSRKRSKKSARPRKKS
jgi:hypothetical protein